MCGRCIKKNGGQAEQCLGRSRGGFSTKIHLLVDGLGYPKRIRLTAGQRHDILKAPDLIAGLKFERVIGDRSYSSFAFVDQIVASGIEVVIPSHPRENEPRDYDEWLYRERHLNEAF